MARVIAAAVLLACLASQAFGAGSGWDAIAIRGGKDLTGEHRNYSSRFAVYERI